MLYKIKKAEAMLRVLAGKWWIKPVVANVYMAGIVYTTVSGKPVCT